ncbi:DUF192 domain-containing protein [Castellaniella hirudinis]|uniref:DUF192 domain-containing protein n=1 Tax=Castellaniella hirudinis TaxID=1144617 RepID=UPI0039C3D72A
MSFYRDAGPVKGSAFLVGPATGPRPRPEPARTPPDDHPAGHARRARRRGRALRGWTLRALALLALALALGAGLWAVQAGAQPPQARLTIGAHTIQAELADTPATLSRGLMHRDHLPADAGMLFLFDQPDIRCFWMKNTRIPLSIAFIDPQGRIVSIQDMQPQSLDTHCSPEAVGAALEMNQGWFRRAGIRAGDRVSGLP